MCVQATFTYYFTCNCSLGFSGALYCPFYIQETNYCNNIDSINREFALIGPCNDDGCRCGNGPCREKLKPHQGVSQNAQSTEFSRSMWWEKEPMASSCTADRGPPSSQVLAEDEKPAKHLEPIQQLEVQQTTNKQEEPDDTKEKVDPALAFTPKEIHYDWQNKPLPPLPMEENSSPLKPNRDRLLRYFRDHTGKITELERYDGRHLRKSNRPGADLGFPLDDVIRQSRPVTQRIVHVDGEVEDWELRGTFWTNREPDLESASEMDEDAEKRYEAFSTLRNMTDAGGLTQESTSSPESSGDRWRHRLGLPTGTIREDDEEDINAIFSGS